MGRQTKFSAEVRERAVRLVWEEQHEHGSKCAAIQAIGSKLGCVPTPGSHRSRTVTRGRHHRAARDEKSGALGKASVARIGPVRCEYDEGALGPPVGRKVTRARGDSPFREGQNEPAQGRGPRD